MRLVESHDRISDTGPERRAQARVGRHGDRRQPRHPRVARIRAQGRSGGSHDAGPGRGQRVEGPGVRVQRVEQRDHAHAIRPQDDVWQGCRSRGQARAADRNQAQGSQGLEDRRQAAEAARHGGQNHRQDDVRDRRQAAWHAQRRDQGLPGVRRQGEELRRRQSRRHEGRQEGRAGRRHCGCGRRRNLVAGQDRARRASDRLGRRPECQGLERDHRRVAQGRSRRRAGLRRQQGRRREGCHRRRGQEGRSGLQLSVPEPRLHGADERDRALYGRQVRGLDGHAER